MQRISASLVLYHNDPQVFERAIEAYLRSAGSGDLVVIDNSREPLVSSWFKERRVKYHFNGRNVGFGVGHNMAFAALPSASDLHLFLNPDVDFKPDVLEGLAGYVEAHGDIGAVMPRVLYGSGELQRLAKLLPTPLDLIFRRFIPLRRLKSAINERYELHGLSQERPSDVPSLSGCFLLVRAEIFQRLGGFDERYFMYMEDVDLVRRIGSIARTVYVPSYSITHGYAKGSYFHRKLLWYHLRSAVAYFSKWGWVCDRDRSLRNRAALLLRNSR